MKNTRQISEYFYNSNQSWYYIKVLIGPDKKRYKVEIRRNSYDSQSYGKVFIWDKAWVLITNTPIEFLECKSSNFTQKPDEVDQNLFIRDAKKLLNEAFQVTA